MLLRPANSGGSTSAPFLISSCAATSGLPFRSTTITRRPFASVFSTGFGNVAERGAAGGGGVACAVADCACVLAGTRRAINNDSELSATLRVIFVLIFPALLVSAATAHLVCLVGWLLVGLLASSKSPGGWPR